MKQLSIIMICLLGLFACQSEQEMKENEQLVPQPQTTRTESSRSLQAGLDVIEQSGFRKEFFGQPDKDWRDMLAFHKNWHGKLGEQRSFVTLESYIYLFLFVDQADSPCPNCRFEYDGSPEMTQALAYYEKHFSEFVNRDPKLTYCFMKELEKARSESEMKAYAAKMRDYFSPHMKRFETALAKKADDQYAKETMAYYNKIKEWAS